MLAFDIENDNEGILLKTRFKKESKFKKRKYWIYNWIFILLLLLSVFFYYIIRPYQYLHSPECIEKDGELILSGGSHLENELTISGYKSVKTLRFKEGALPKLKILKISSRIINIF